MCVYGGTTFPWEVVGDHHLVTVPQGVAGDRLPWGGEGQGGEGTTSWPAVSRSGLFSNRPEEVYHILESPNFQELS